MVLMLVSVLAVVILVANLDDTDLGGSNGPNQEMVDDIVNGLLPIALVLASVLFVYIVITVFSKRTRMRGAGQKDRGKLHPAPYHNDGRDSDLWVGATLRRTARGEP